MRPGKRWLNGCPRRVARKRARVWIRYLVDQHDKKGVRSSWEPARNGDPVQATNLDSVRLKARYCVPRKIHGRTQVRDRPHSSALRASDPRRQSLAKACNYNPGKRPIHEKPSERVLTRLIQTSLPIPAQRSTKQTSDGKKIQHAHWAHSSLPPYKPGSNRSSKTSLIAIPLHTPQPGWSFHLHIVLSRHAQSLPPKPLNPTRLVRRRLL